MSEDTTTTTEQETVQAQEIEQPESPETQAVQAEEEISEADTTDQTETSEDDDILDWASKKGLKVNEDTRPLLQMVRDSERLMHTATNEAKQAKELQNSVTTIGEEQGLDETSQLLDRLRVKEFYMDHPEAKSLDDEMAKIVTAKPYLAEDLETVLELAKARQKPVQEIQERQLGRKEALAQVAKAETAAPPQASATTRETSSEITAEDIIKMTPAEYVQYKKDHPEFNPFA